jgi:signal transduction histidine kinase
VKPEPKQFKISTGLKNLIGRELITDEFVAVFELVKNSFDAHASAVRISFEENTITIADNGKGMSRKDILDKWLFVAYSAKKDGTEDSDYRDHIGERNRTFAGAKGVGRFSCDRLGEELQLSTRSRASRVQVLDIDWSLYEENPKKEFGQIDVLLSEAEGFANARVKPKGSTGTVLKIQKLRSTWERQRIQALKRELTKLIDPFSQSSKKFEIEIVAPAEEAADEQDKLFNEARRGDQYSRLIVNGKIENPILEVLKRRTTAIRIHLSDNGTKLDSTLEDRGELIYSIREINPYPGLAETELSADIYFLNRSAKSVFAHRMGLPSIQFGSIFLFRNGFRVLPIGADDDDYFGLNSRKQQGQRRYLGGRDLIGRVEVKGAKGFDEATSRNQGLLRTPEVQELVDCIRDKCVRRLERYVVDITWRDKFDQNVDDTSRMRLDESSALVTQLVSRLAATEGVEIISYNPDLVRIVDEKSNSFELSIKALELLAEETGDKELLARVDYAKARIKALQEAEAEAREAEQRAEARAVAAETAAATAGSRLEEEKERNDFLVAATSLDQDTILNLHHQIIIHASDVHHGVKRMMGKLRAEAKISNDEWTDFLERVSYRNSQILTAARFATKGGYKQQSSEVTADLSVYFRDYLETVSTLWAPRGITIRANTDGKPVVRTFRPIEIGIVIDNLVSNAAKARATTINFFLTSTKGQKPQLIITVADDGIGWPKKLTPIERAFDKGVTTTDGSGLGLFHVKQVIESLGGTIEPHAEQYSPKLNGAQLTIRLPS